MTTPWHMKPDWDQPPEKPEVPMTDKTAPEWVVVPREPTAEMLKRGRPAAFNGMYAGYKAMLAAAPSGDLVPVPRKLAERLLVYGKPRTKDAQELRALLGGGKQGGQK